MRRRARGAIAVAAVALVVMLASIAVIPRIAAAAGLPAVLPHASAVDDGTAPPAAVPAPSPTAPPTLPSAPAAPSGPAVPVSAAAPDPDGCAHTEMSVWAHPDDDLLFPQTIIASAIAAGDCVRTVFLTSGDAGNPAGYWQGRERGIMRAYNVLRGASSPWSSRAVTLSSGANITLWQPNDDPKLTLAFFHLPDGSTTGQGYARTGWTSLAKLNAARISSISDTAGTYSLSADGIVASLTELIGAFAPTTFMTFVPGTAPALSSGDHPDHATTGILARRAWQAAGLDPASVRYAMGYPTSWRAANVVGASLHLKIAAFRTYAADDSVVGECRDDATCLKMRNFGGWLQREYLFTEGDLPH